MPTSDVHDNLFFNDPNLIRLNDSKQNELELTLTKGKCPGGNGLSVEFYLHFWSLLEDTMVQSFNYSFKHGHLNITQKQGIIKNVPKKTTSSRKLATNITS